MANTAFEVEDFSGGLTDFFLQGDKKRYQYASNLLIDEDRKLFLRPGSDGFDYAGNHRLPEVTRIGTFLFYEKDKEILVHQGRKLFYLADNWTEITGPEGASAIGGGSPFDNLSWSDWDGKGHVYFSSAGGGLPGKLYKDSEGDFQVRTVGLPLPAAKPRYSKAGLLAACINLANDIRYSMVNHMADTTLHSLADTTAAAFLTSAPAASSEASLYTLVGALNQVYESHAYDPDIEAFHKGFADLAIDVGTADVGPPKGPFKKLSNNGTPSSITEAAACLDELRTRWYWHRLSVYTHDKQNTYTTLNRYPVTAPAIGSTDTSGIPYVTPNYDEVLRYVNYLKNLYNVHVSNGAFGADWFSAYLNASHAHSQKLNSDAYTLCTLPDATDLDSAYLIIYWIWAMYGMIHIFDAKVTTHTNTKIDTTAGSADVTDVGGSGTGNVTMPVGAWVIATSDIFDDVDANNRRAAKVTASGSGTATLSKKLLATVNDQAVQYSYSLYHGGYSSQTFTSVTTSQVDANEQLDPAPVSGLGSNNLALPETLEAWIDRAQVVFQALSYHVQNGDAHYASDVPYNYLQLNGKFYKPQIASYGYAVVYKHTYTTKQGIEFQVESAPTFFGPIETAKQFQIGTQLDSGFSAQDTGVEYAFSFDGRVETVASSIVQNLPELKNTSLTNYDVTEVVLEIYRTQDGGNTYYLLGEVANGVSTYTDSVSDTTSSAISPQLTDRATLYTTGGEVAHDQPQESRFVHIFQNIAYYGYITDTGQVFKDRVLQSVPGAPDAVPADFSYDLGDELMGITSTRNNVVALCRHSIHRLQGGYTNLGQGTLTAERIVGESGCISSKSIVRTEIGIFFAGTDGFYYTDGYQLIKISIDLNRSYNAFTQTEEQASRIHGAYDKRTRRIWWNVQSESSSTDCDKTYVYYLDYGVKPSGVFTGPIENGTHWAPSALAFFQDDMIRGDKRGLLLRHNARYKSDLKIPDDVDDFDALDQWGRVHIPYRYLSSALDFGTIAKGNYVTKIHLLGANKGNAAVQIAAIADNNNFARSKKDLAPIRYRDNLVWGDPNIVWGDEETQWKTDGRMDVSRHFPSGNLRAQLKQIEIRPAYTGVYKSQEMPEGAYCDVATTTIDGEDVIKATLQTPTGFTELWWPMDVTDMVIAFSNDDYEAEYPIVQWFNTEITITDEDGNLPGDLENQEWVIRGYQKEVGFHMLAYSLDVAILGDRGNAAPGTGGENA